MCILCSTIYNKIINMVFSSKSKSSNRTQLHTRRFYFFKLYRFCVIIFQNKTVVIAQNKSQFCSIYFYSNKLFANVFPLLILYAYLYVYTISLAAIITSFINFYFSYINYFCFVIFSYFFLHVYLLFKTFVINNYTPFLDILVIFNY